MNRVKLFCNSELSGWKLWEVVWILFSTIVITCLSFYWGDNFRGIISATSGVICVVLTGKGKLSCYAFGLINTLLYAWIAFDAHYYGEVMLNALYYAPMQFVGWAMWKKHINNTNSEVKKTRLAVKWQIILVGIAILSIYFYGMFLKLLGGDLPFVDSMSTCLSVLAMIFTVKRLTEQWILWIVVDIVSVYMWVIAYLSGGTDISTLMMWMIYLLNAVFMFFKWNKESRKEVFA